MAAELLAALRAGGPVQLFTLYTKGNPPVRPAGNVIAAAWNAAEELSTYHG